MSKAPALPPLAPGAQLRDGTKVIGPLGRDAGAIRYRANHPLHGQVELLLLNPTLAAQARQHRDYLDALIGVRGPGLQALLGYTLDDERPRLFYELCEGTTLAQAAASVTEEQVRFRIVYNLLGHLVQGLSALHGAMPHGALTADFVRVLPSGGIVISGAGYARLLLAAMGTEKGPFEASAFLAPEVREDPWAVTEASDFFSIGVVALQLLVGQLPTSHNLPYLLDEIPELWGEDVQYFLQSLLVQDAGMRVSSPDELFSLLRQTLSALRREGRSGETAEELGQAGADDDGDDFELAGERWLIERDGRDYGPYTPESVMEQFEAEEINEDTRLRDSWGDVTGPLDQLYVFEALLVLHTPERDRRRAEREEREERQRELVKQSSRGVGIGIFVGIPLTLVVLVGAFGFIFGDLFWTPAEPYPFERIPRRFSAILAFETPAYEAIEADSAFLANLFDMREVEAAPRASGRPSLRQRQRADEEPIWVEEDEVEYSLSLDTSRPFFRLTQPQINATVSQHAAGLQSCFMDELRAKPSFRGATVDFSIQPNGRPFSVRVRGDASPALRACVVRSFRQMRFPEFNDVAMNISYPFQVQ